MRPEKRWRHQVTGGQFGLPAFSIALATRVSDFVAATIGRQKPHPAVLRGLLASNDLSLASAAAHACLERSSNDPVIRTKLAPMQRALQPGNSRRLYAGARSILRRMREGKAELQETLLAAATDLWSAGLVLEHERRSIRHFAGRNFISKGEG